MGWVCVRMKLEKQEMNMHQLGSEHVQRVGLLNPPAPLRFRILLSNPLPPI
jgi:hypothetical protein